MSTKSAEAPGDGKRIRTLTSKANEQFEETAQNFQSALGRAWTDIDTVIRLIPSLEKSTSVRKDFLENLTYKFESYKDLSEKYVNFLTNTHTQDSLSARDSHLKAVTSQDKFVRDNLRLMDKWLQEAMELSSRHSARHSSHHSTMSGESISTTSSSLAARKRAKAEAAKARLAFIEKEAELKKKKSELEIDIEMLNARKEAAAAEAEADALDSSISNSDKCSVSVPVENANDRTLKFVSDLQLDPKAPEFVPLERQNHTNTTSVNEFTRVFLKKDLLVSSLTKFNDQPENYLSWKKSFQTKVKEIGVTPLEELDLLVKWSGPESQKQVLSVKTANFSDPQKGLQRVWDRLDERYGCPEMIEASLKRKLNDFPKLSVKDDKRLYELTDIVSEIEAVKEDKQYKSLLSYFDSSAGVTPIVNKLPHSLQERWIASASRYMADHHVTYPPFSHFVAFLREQSRIRNNPSFIYDSTAASKPVQRPVQRNYPHVTARKTSTVLGVSTCGDETGDYCPLHNSRHSLNKCRKFRSKPIDVRRKFLQDRNICYRCCDSSSHKSRDCKAVIHCEECSSDKHVTALHVMDYNNNKQNTSLSSSSSRNGGQSFSWSSATRKQDCPSAQVNTSCTQICGDGFSGKSCAKIVQVRVYPKGRYNKAVVMYALIDDQSNRSLASSELFDTMGIKDNGSEYILSSCAGKIKTKGRRLSNCVVESLDTGTSLDLPTIIECDQLPNIREEIPTPQVAAAYSHLQDIVGCIPPLNEGAEIMLLLGRDLISAHHVLDQRIGQANAPYAQKLPLGWTIIGETCLGKVHQPAMVTAYKTNVLCNGRSSIFEVCPNVFTVRDSPGTSGKADVISEHDDYETLGRNVFVKTKDDEQLSISQEDKAFLQVMDEQFAKDRHGNWTAPLPFRSSRPRLPNNRSQALKRAQILHTDLLRNSVKREHLVVFMQGILENHHAEVAPALAADEECWYLPLFGVYHPKKPNKIRGVFDSSAKCNGISLNQVLLKGPNMTNSLCGILLRFRKDAVAVTGDIEQMFYCFSVKEDHRNFLRFLWYEGNDPSKELIEYRMCKHVFGNSPSPAVANYGLRRTVQEAESEFGSDVRQFVESDFYVDDGLLSKPSPGDTIDLMKRTQKALQTASIRLHKITSNCKEVIDAFPADDLAVGIKDKDLGFDMLPTQHSLGLRWELDADVFTFKVSDDAKPYTRRGILSTINSLYDLLGFLAPVTIRGKILLREMVAETKDWDEPLPEDIRQPWERWKEDLRNLETLKVSRTYHPFPGNAVASQALHVYSDASEKAIAAVAYLQTIDNAQNTHVGFVFGKTKVAPKQGHTVPRLELCASVLAVEIAEMICKELALPAETVTYYTDSKIVLGYLQNQTRKFYMYVSNRVDKILRISKPDQWFYVTTDKNPADDGTRYVAPAFLRESLWLQGPVIQPQEESHETISSPLVDPDIDREIRQEVTVFKSDVRSSCGLPLGSIRMERFSSWASLVRAIAYLQHIAAGFQLPVSNKCHGWHLCSSHKTVESFARAETLIVKVAQCEFYSEEITSLKVGKSAPRNSKVISLSPVLDHEGILRVGGRLKNADIPVCEKNPILIPGQHYVAKLIVQHYHEKVHHQGRHLTEGAVREAGFWITGGKRLISSMIHNCVTCRKLRGHLSFQRMADLPSDRLESGPPFTSVGVDCFGPWQVVMRKTRGGQANSKRWAVMFSCLASRAVHIEVIEELSTSSFINALRRFIAIRGKVKIFRSDHGTNFIGTVKELGINVESDIVKKFLLDENAMWIFNPPHASHMGGVWERMIGVARRILDYLLNNKAYGVLTHEVLCTFLAEVTAIMNSRPLVPLSSDPQNPYPLSPSMILTHKSDNVVDITVPFDTKNIYRIQWKRVQQLAESFWRRWRSEFLQSLQGRRKWTENQRDFMFGDVVLLRDKQVARNRWPMGVVTQAFPGADGKIRTVEVHVVLETGKSTVYTRPIHELALLVPSET